MRPSPAACSKASRFQLISKHANKDYYKGRRQSHPDGIGYRTGPPGAFVRGTTAIYKIDPARVRVFVGPAFKEGSSDFAFDNLKPFASTTTPTSSGYPYGLPGRVRDRAAYYHQLTADLADWPATRAAWFDELRALRADAADVRDPEGLGGVRRFRRVEVDDADAPGGKRIERAYDDAREGTFDEQLALGLI